MSRPPFEITLNVDAFLQKAKQLNDSLDQLPFALSTMLNDAAFAARRVLTEVTWPSHVTARNRTFISASLRVEKATKSNLRIKIYDVLGRGKLKQHATGGSAQPQRSRVFAIPIPGRVQRTTRGVASKDRPRNLVTNSRRAVRITPKGIFVGEHGRLVLKYAFKPSVFIHKDVPFYEDFAYTIGHHCRTSFAEHMARAVATRR